MKILQIFLLFAFVISTIMAVPAFPKIQIVKGGGSNRAGGFSEGISSSRIFEGSLNSIGSNTRINGFESYPRDIHSEWNRIYDLQNAIHTHANQPEKIYNPSANKIQDHDNVQLIGYSGSSAPNTNNLDFRSLRQQLLKILEKTSSTIPSTSSTSRYN